MENLKRRSVEFLTIKLPPQTELKLGPQSVSDVFFTKAENLFEICPSSEQSTPNLLRIRNKEDDSILYLIVPEVESFPCPVRNVKPDSHGLVSMYEVLIALLKEWEKGNTHLRITTSIETIFGKIGQIQNRIIQEDFYDETSRS